MDTVLAVCKRYGVDLAHAQHVSSLALALFDAARQIPQPALSDRARELVEAGALLHNIGLNLDEENHHTLGRDLVLATPLKSFSQSERAQLALIVAFHRRAVNPADETIFGELDARAQQETLALSALVRIADGLDASQSQSTSIRNVSSEGASLTIRAQGPHSHDDAARADKKADLWRSVYGAVRITGRLSAPGLDMDMPLAEAGQRIMRYHFDQIDPDLWLPKDDGENWTPKQIKSLRLAVRRLRIDLRLFEPYFKKKTVRAIGRGLKDLSEMLGEPRDMDMLIEMLRAYQAACDEEARQALEPLLEHWKQRRKTARARMHDYIRSDAYARWAPAVAAFVSGYPDDDVARRSAVGEPSRVRHVAQAWLWQHVSQVRAFDTLADSAGSEDLHNLRIAIKRLRYYADAMREVLPAEDVTQWIDKCLAAQAELGAINDAQVAAQQALEFASTQRGGRKNALRAIVGYAEAQQRVVDTRKSAWRSAVQPLL